MNRRARHELEGDAMSGPMETTEPREFRGEPPRWTWGEVAALSLILAVGGSLRFHRIAEHSFWIDEFFTMESVNGTSLAGTFAVPLNKVLEPAPRPTMMAPLRPWWNLLRPDGHDNNPPLFYLLTRMWVS